VFPTAARRPETPAELPTAGTVGDFLKQLDSAKDRATLHVDGHDLAVTNLDKALWPGAGRRKAVTKRFLLRYLARVSRWMLPHLSDRPLFVTRFPNGIGGKSFYQKHWDDPPPFARTVAIYSSQGDTDGDYLVCENLATLLWLGQMASLEAGGDPWNGILEAKQDLGGILGVGGAA
jgi:bifunctional non-homologous end joining protein LigD